MPLEIKKRKKKALSRKDRLAQRIRKVRRIDAAKRREILVAHCLKMEELGPREGQAKMRVEANMYDPQVGEYHRVPGKRIALLVDSLESVEEAFEVMEEGLRVWSKGRWVQGHFQCQCGRILK